MSSDAKITASQRKRNLHLNIHRINSDFPTNFAKSPQKPVWKDKLVQGQFHGICSKKGPFRQNMEDRFCVCLSGNFLSFGVYDGHNGGEAAEFASSYLQTQIRSFTLESLTEAFEQTDLAFCNSSSNTNSGTTAAVLMAQEDKLIVGNLGDTKVLVVSEETFEIISQDHLASDNSEREKVEESGGFIVPVGSVMRVQGRLSVTRSIGDCCYKEYLSSKPFVCSRKLGQDDLVAVVASDGLFERLECGQIASYVREMKDRGMGQLAEGLTNKAISSGTRDNVTVVSVDLKEMVCRFQTTQTGV
mmetsp:Transcript_10822/g.16178  ORF Transcript_10822/g.16178 Transcript_10822/m.16178 type:complete len:302 (-) Transcript_10822:273-1178(-)